MTTPMAKPDWADDVAYQSVRREIAEGTYSVELDILAAALRKAKEDGFESGVRYVLENIEAYRLGKGPSVLQFDDYTLAMIHKPTTELTKVSADHRERRIQAILFCARATALEAGED